MENKKFIGENITIQKAANILSCYKEGDVLLKAYNDTIQKAEGARGGKVIGHTKSGKPIYESANHPSHKNFSIAEHNDAIEAHQKVRDEYRNKHNSTDEDKKANDHAYEQQKEHIGAKNHLMRDMTPAQARAAVAESEANNVKKSEGDDITKGGEGSKGGKVIGHTKSGKPIYESLSHTGYTPKYSGGLSHKKISESYSHQDHKDAAEAYREHAKSFNKENDPHDHKGAAHRIAASFHEEAAKEKFESENKNKHIETDDKGIHSVEHKGSKYYSKPDEAKEDFSKRVKQAIKEDHKDDVEFKKSEETSDLQKAYETLGLNIQKEN